MRESVLYAGLTSEKRRKTDMYAPTLNVLFTW